MTTATQADFARLHGVSRKTVTDWKARGYLSISEGLVDVEASNVGLARAGRSRLNPVTRTAASLRTDAQGNALPVRTSPPGNTPKTAAMLSRHAQTYPGVLSLSVLAGSRPELVLALLAHLPMATVRPLVEEVSQQDLAAAAEMADEDVAPPEGFRTWAAHPWFTDGRLTEAEWSELAHEAANTQASAKAARAPCST